ncbi:uncharacterized protein LOC135378435 isoform X2 [Ornithodoros turicata]|uniref:uncharacterized protein LOC135378435 isoform X2 n=1 Tax=Ornithodoros turicata TaxID=34597 RepID=UPI003138BE9F
MMVEIVRYLLYILLGAVHRTLPPLDAAVTKRNTDDESETSDDEADGKMLPERPTINACDIDKRPPSFLQEEESRRQSPALSTRTIRRISRNPSCRCPRPNNSDPSALLKEEVPCICCSSEDSDDYIEDTVSFVCGRGLTLVSGSTVLNTRASLNGHATKLGARQRTSLTYASNRNHTETSSAASVHLLTTVSAATSSTSAQCTVNINQSSSDCVGTSTSLSISGYKYAKSDTVAACASSSRPRPVSCGLTALTSRMPPSSARRSVRIDDSLDKGDTSCSTKVATGSEEPFRKVVATSNPEPNKANETPETCTGKDTRSTVSVQQLAQSLRNNQDDHISFFFTTPSPSLENRTFDTEDEERAYVIQKAGRETRGSELKKVRAVEVDGNGDVAKRELVQCTVDWRKEAESRKPLQRPRLLPTKKRPSDVVPVIEAALSSLYEPFHSVQVVLLSQTKDIFLRKFFGDIDKFTTFFLQPAVELLSAIKQKVRHALKIDGTESSRPSNSNGCHTCISQQRKSWPLCFNRRVVVHLGELDSSVLRPGDFYFALAPPERTANPEDPPGLSVRYRNSSTGRLKRLDLDASSSVLFTMDWLRKCRGSTQAGGKTDDDEELVSVLKHLLVSVERGVERIEYESLVKGKAWVCEHKFPSHYCCCKASQIPSTPSPMAVDMKDSGVQANLNANERVTCTVCGCVRMSGDCSRRTSASSGIEGGASSETDSAGRSREGSLTGVLPPESLSSLFREGASLSQEDFDDGYHDNSLAQPASMSQLDQDLLHSGVACLPGCRDAAGRSVVVVRSAIFKELPDVPPCQLACLLMYFHTIPKKETILRGFQVLVDASEATEQFWTTLDEAFSLVEANISSAISSVVVWKGGSQLDGRGTALPQSRVKIEPAPSYEKLLRFITNDNLLPEFGGCYAYDHQEWMGFRKFLEPFMSGCRLCGRQLVTMMQDLRTGRLPPSSALASEMMEAQKRHIQNTFQDEQLRHLQEEGDTILQELQSYRNRSPHNPDYRDSLERSVALYNELKRAMTKLTKAAEKRLQRLQECMLTRTFEEESSQVLSWICKHGEEALSKHHFVADSLSGIQEQEYEFEKFYFLAMRHLEKGNDLLEEATMMSSPGEGGTNGTTVPSGAIPQEMACSLRQHLDTFSEKLEDTRERLEDTSRCYLLLDQSYEWALDAMKFVSGMKMEDATTSEQLLELVKLLNDYLDDHPPLPENNFQEMLDLACRLGNTKLLEQCKTAKARCRETVELIEARQATLSRARQQLDLDGRKSPLGCPRVPTWDPSGGENHGAPLGGLFSHKWSPGNASTPYCSSFVRRRSIATTQPHLYSPPPPMNSYTAFPGQCGDRNSRVQDSFAVDQYIQEKEEQLLSQGLITDDLTRRGPVTSISRSFLEARSKEGTGPKASSTMSGLSALREKVRNSLHKEGHLCRPQRKLMRRSYTWQLCEDALTQASQRIREQNQRFGRGNHRISDLENSSDGQPSSVSSPESEELTSPDSPDQLSKSSPDGGSGGGCSSPVAVNSHLLTRASTLQLADSAMSDANFSEQQLRNKKTLLLIMREMVQTERDYVKSLEYIIESYIPELMRDDIPQALRGQRNVVFGNIEKIYEFHSRYFLQELEHCESSPFLVGQCFLKYEPQFYLYALYNKNKPKSDTLMSEYGNAFFRRKQLELGDKMDLASYLLKPVQRMGKYALLLKQLLKECPEREPEQVDLKVAEDMVRFQLRHGNDLLAMDALRECDVNVKEQGRLLRQDEFLVWQGRSRKCIRQVFLFEDLILFSKVRRDPEHKGHDVYQYKQSIKTTDIGLTEQIGESPTKFEIWFRKRKLNDVYLLQAPSPEVKLSWIQDLAKLLWKQALRNREMRLAEMSSMGIGNKPCLDIRPSNDQINDRSISVHQLSRTAPRFRSMGAGGMHHELGREGVLGNNKRPHSIISVSSSSSSSSSQSSFYCARNLGFENGDSPRPLHRSLTQQSQCSNESGFCTDASTGGDCLQADASLRPHRKAERSDSLLSNDSVVAHSEEEAPSLLQRFSET